MEEKFKQFLKKQMEKEAEQIEKEVLSNESLKEVQAPDTLREALAKSIKGIGQMLLVKSQKRLGSV